MIAFQGRIVRKQVVGEPMTREQIELLTKAMSGSMARYTVIVNGMPCLNLDEIMFEGMMN